jgi:hypothetical protein
VQHLRSTILLLVFCSRGINAAAVRQFRNTDGIFLPDKVTCAEFYRRSFVLVEEEAITIACDASNSVTT